MTKKRSKRSGEGRRWSTAEVAKALGVHPNTVRLYEQWGFLPPIPRSPSGYREYSDEHVEQMRLARTALHGGWPGRNIRQSALVIVKRAASGDLGGALEQAYQHLALVKAERAQAETAAGLLERWAQGAATDATITPLPIHEAAKLLRVTIDMLHNWERNGLLTVPRDPRNGYRRYGAAEIGRLRVIRTLLRAGYSTMAILRMLRQFDRGQRLGLRDALDGAAVQPVPEGDIVYATDRWLSMLAAHEQRAMDLIAQIECMMGW